MINKKLLAVASVIATIFSSSALAKTEGYYAGIHLVNTDTKFTHQDGFVDNDNSNNGVGASFKHAFNFDGVFVAPGLFFDKTNGKVRNGTSNAVIDARYGIKADIGYDIAEKLAVYVTGGLSFVDYKIQSTGLAEDKERSKSSWFGGAGIAYDYSDRVVFNLEYNTQSVDANTPQTGLSDAKLDLNTILAGISYRF
jgi:opacity protein-like surface antigen